MLTTLLLAAAITLAVPTASPHDWPRPEATLRGTLGPVTRLHRPDGPTQAVAVLRLDDARGPATVFVVLGAHDEVRGLRLRPGVRVVVRGRSGFLAGERVLFAQSVERARGRAERAVQHAVLVRRHRPRGRAVDDAVTRRQP